MSEKHLTRRELQSPDKFQSAFADALAWGREHPRDLAILAAGVVVAVGIVAFFLGGHGHRHVAGGAELTSALGLVDRPVAEKPAEGAEATSPDEATFPTEQAKRDAVAAALTKVRDEHKNSEAGVEAGMALADTQLQAGKNDEALKLFDEYLTEAPTTAPLRFLAFEGKAQAQVGLNDLPGALATYQKLETELPGYKDRAMFGKAGVLEKQGKWDEARTLYEGVKGYEGGSTLSSVAGERLSALNRVHPPPPAPATPAPSGTPTSVGPAGG